MTDKEKEDYQIKHLVRSNLYLALDTGIRLAALQDILKYKAALEKNTVTEEIRIRHDYALELIEICNKISDKEEKLLEIQ